MKGMMERVCAGVCAGLVLTGACVWALQTKIVPPSTPIAAQFPDGESRTLRGGRTLLWGLCARSLTSALPPLPRCRHLPGGRDPAVQGGVHIAAHDGSREAARVQLRAHERMAAVRT